MHILFNLFLLNFNNNINITLVDLNLQALLQYCFELVLPKKHCMRRQPMKAQMVPVIDNVICLRIALSRKILLQFTTTALN